MAFPKLKYCSHITGWAKNGPTVHFFRTSRKLQNVIIDFCVTIFPYVNSNVYTEHIFYVSLLTSLFEVASHGESLTT